MGIVKEIKCETTNNSTDNNIAIIDEVGAEVLNINISVKEVDVQPFNEETVEAIDISKEIKSETTNDSTDNSAENTNAVYAEFLKQQRLISFESTHTNKKDDHGKITNQSLNPVDGEKMSTVLCLHGYNVTFDVF